MHIEREAIKIVLEAIAARPGYKPSQQVSIALDPASSEFYDPTASGSYVFRNQQSTHTSRKWPRNAKGGGKNIPIVSIEDGMAEDDWAGGNPYARACGSKSSKNRNPGCGDGTFVTNTARLSTRRQGRHRQTPFSSS